MAKKNYVYDSVEPITEEDLCKAKRLIYMEGKAKKDIYGN